MAVPGRRDDFLDDYSLGFSRRVPITRRLRETVEKRPSSAGLRSKEVARSGGEGSGRLLLAVQGEEGRGERKEKESNSPRELLPKQATHDGDPPRGNPISFCPLARPNRVTRFETSPRTRIRSLSLRASLPPNLDRDKEERASLSS